MKNILTFGLFESSGRIPWDELDELACKLMSSRDFSPVRAFARKNPRFDPSYINDKILVPLSNHGIVKRGITIEQRIIMLMELIRDFPRSNDDIDIDIDVLRRKGFRQWYENGRVVAYRGIPGEDADDDFNGEKLKSFSLKKSYAKRFTNPAWLAGEFRPSEAEQTGYLITASLAPSEIYIYNDADSECEVIPSDYTVSGVERVVEGEIRPLSESAGTQDRTWYHGTNNKFDRFELRGKKGPSTFGVWFSDDPEFAKMFGDHVMTAGLDIENPYIISQDRWDEIRGEHALDTQWFKRWRDELVSKGYDSLFIRERKQKFAGADVRDPNIVGVLDLGIIDNVKELD